MTIDSTLTQALAILGELMGGNAPAFDEDGLCVLSHEDGFAITLMTAPGADILLLSAQLMEVPEVGRESLFAWLLRLNFLGLDTGGAALSIDEEERHVYLCHSVPLARVDAQTLVGIIGNFLDVSAVVRQRLLTQADSAASTDGSASTLVSGRLSGWIQG
jgi:Tir chaperone protein (CesT) family